LEENFASGELSRVRMHAVKRRRAVKSLVCSRRGTNYRSGDILRKGLGTENCLPAEYSGYVSAAAAAVATAVAAAAAV